MNSRIKYLLKRIYYRLHSDFPTEYLVKHGLVVGKDFCRMHGTIIDPSHCWLIHIGDNVTIAPRAHILAHDASTCKILGYARIGNVEIGDNVFIGAETVVLPNTKIGANSIIGANSTVTHDIPANVVAAGCPAKVICTLDEYISTNKMMMEESPCYGEEYTARNPKITKEMKEQMYLELKDRYGYIV